MSHCSSHTWRRTLGVLTAASLLTTGLAATTSAANAAPSDRSGSSTAGPSLKKTPKGDKLGAADREKLDDAIAEGARTVTVMVVANKGEVAQAKKDLRELGGTLRYSADKLGYFSAVLPTGTVDRAAKLTAVQALDLDEVVPIPDAKEKSPGKPSPVVTGGPSASTPDDNPFMPTRETGSITFKRQHPTWDGRGITIGVLDSGIDLAHPALQKTSTGERKIVDTFTATSVYEGDGTWRAMRTEVKPTEGSFSASNLTWRSPDGVFKFNRFSESSTALAGCEVCGDVNRDGDTQDRWGILYDPKTNDIIVDVNQNQDFTDDEVRRPYNEKFQVGTFGTDNPATGVVEAMPFTVDFVEDMDLKPFGLPGTADFVDIGLMSGAHGTHVAGITAANDMFGGAMDGQAPGAKIVAARACSFGPGCTAAALTDGMAELATNRGVDIINMSIGGLPALNDGDNARAVLYNRIIADGVQLVISAGNSGNALNTIGDPSVATDVVSVGASISRETWKANYGSDVAFAKNMLTFSSGGPREDGGFKPNITAPGSAISTTPTWQPGGPVAQAGYALPAGYSMFNGTSMASPQAAGAMALMISGARQDGRPATSPAALRAAVYSTAVYNPTVPAFLQGHGEIDVVQAYQLLKRSPAPDTFTVAAPVCTEVNKIIGKTVGTGLYNRCAAGAGGQAAGEARTYPVTITRTTGARASGSYATSVIGNDGTFSVSPATVVLPLGTPVTVQVTATPTPGAHTALLRLDDSKTLGVDSSTMLAVVAGSALAAPAFEAGAAGTTARNQAVRHYVTVPTGAKALQVQIGGLAAGTQTRFIAFHPFGLPIDSTSSLACYSNFSNESTCNSAKRVYSNPQPGVWEILVETRRTSPVASTGYTLTTSVLGVTVDPASQEVATATAGVGTSVTWNVRNDFGAVTAAGQGGTLGSALADRPSITNEGVLTRTVAVPAGATQLDVSIGSTSDTGADLDLYVTGPSGAKQAADGDSEEAVSYTNPTAGIYTITVEGYAVPAGTTTFNYLDVFTSPGLGTLEVNDTSAVLLAGATRTVTGTLTARTAAAQGRKLFGQMRFVSDGGALLGTGSVTVGAVTTAR